MGNRRYFLITASIMLLGAASAQADKLDSNGIVRFDNGSIHYMNPYDAMKACPAGMHVPTIREIAKESQGRGAKGILEVNQVNPNEIPSGYYKISSIDLIGRKDEFYFSNEGYKRPDGDLGNYWFWSSWFYSERCVYDIAWFLNGASGNLAHDEYCAYDYRQNPVRCVRDR